jgi:hypothetical protein
MAMTKPEVEITSHIFHMGRVKVRHGFNIFTPWMTDTIKEKH